MIFNMNIIKISSLKGHIIVNEKDKKKIKGINASPVETVGSVVIPIYINKQLFTVKKRAQRNRILKFQVRLERNLLFSYSSLFSPAGLKCSCICDSFSMEI